jgi:hypothetical protein
MASLLNFKNISLLLIIFTSLVIYSCMDSLGLESNVKRTLIDSVVIIKPVIKPVKFVADSLTIDITEELTDIKNGTTIMIIPWTVKINYDSILVDSILSTSNLWAKLDFENSNDSLRMMQNQHIKAIQLILDSIPATGGLSLNGVIKSPNWSMAAIEDLPSGKQTLLEGYYSPLSIQFFEDIRKANYGSIRAKLFAKFIPDSAYYYINFTANIYVGYKIK